MNNCYCVCLCGSTFSDFIGNWQTLLRKKGSYAIIDTQGKTAFYSLPNAFFYTESDIRNNLGFFHEVSKKHYWNAYGNRNIVWFYAHFRMLNFYLKHPNFDFYWFFDDDVKCDNWDELLGGPNCDIDFLIYFVF